MSTNFAELQISKIHKDIQKSKCYLYNTSWVFGFSYKPYLAINSKLCNGYMYPLPDFTLPDEQISNRVQNVIICVENM